MILGAFKTKLRQRSENLQNTVYMEPIMTSCSLEMVEANPSDASETFPIWRGEEARRCCQLTLHAQVVLIV